MVHESDRTNDESSTSGSSTSGSSTNRTLLQMLCGHPEGETAWELFVARYQPLILSWCHGYGLPPDDAADVAQNVMLRMTRFIKDFQYDPNGSFRAWLKTVTHHAWRDWTTAEKRHLREQPSDEVLGSIQARDNLIERLQQEYDAEVLEVAVLRVQLRVSAPVWQAFELTAFHGMSGIDAAKELEMNVATLYVHKSRVTKFLQEEIKKVEPDH